MATRTYFTPKSDSPYFLENDIEFNYLSGFALSQQQKSICNMHSAILSANSKIKILEISTKSANPIGNRLSAFNLTIDIEGKALNVESVYQASKLFEFGGPYRDIATLNSLDAKRDLSLKNSGKLLGYIFNGEKWFLSESPNFFDYLYAKAVVENRLTEELISFNAFTDFAYSNKAYKRSKNRSFNCQARSAAIIVGLFPQFGDLLLDEIIKLAKLNSSLSEENQTSLFD